MKKFKYLKISNTKKLRYMDNYFKKKLYIIFLPGFMSDIDGEKPQAFRKYAIKKKIGFLFGPEKAGLSNEDISHANLQIKIPTNSVFGSLNLAMAVNIICYECFIKEPSMISKTSFNLYSLANKKELNFFKNRLIEILKETNFLSVKDNHEKLIINVKNIFSKSLLSNKDLKILHGIITHLKNYENK